jgi:hypothetical protein
VEVYGSNPEAGTITMKVARRSLEIVRTTELTLIKKLLVPVRVGKRIPWFKDHIYV